MSCAFAGVGFGTNESRVRRCAVDDMGYLARLIESIALMTSIISIRTDSLGHLRGHNKIHFELIFAARADGEHNRNRRLQKD